MYSEWVALSKAIRNDESGRSALSVYPSSVGRDVARVVVKSLVDPKQNSKTRFKCAEDIKWTMHVICFGLGLPLSEGETLKSCVAIYLDWLSSLSLHPKQEVPQEVLKDPNVYCQRILHHFKNLFVPKTEGTLVLQASLCMKVLQGIKRISHECSKMNETTLKVMLEFLLSISDFLLSPPFVPGGLTEHLCKLLIEVLFDAWLQACVWGFPDPPLWNTLQEMCCTWRHHTDFVTLWNKTVFSITRRMLLNEYGSSFPLYPLEDKKHEIHIPTTLDNKCLVQSWFRFLHIMGNPVDLSNKDIISNTSKFREHALVSTNTHQPSEHSCLSSMPQNFYAAMKGIATLADTLLGKKCLCESPVMFTHIPPDNSAVLNSSKNESRNKVQTAVSTDQLANLTPEMDWKLAGRLDNHQSGGIFDKSMCIKNHTSMPMENSVLHLLGTWLFEATLASVNVTSVKRKLHETWQNYLTLKDKATSFESDDNQSIGYEGYHDFEQGRAEAFGALCRIFCSQRSGVVLPVYLSRFYFSLAAGLIFDKSCSGHVLSSILLNSTDLLRVNLPGVDVLIPHLIAALEKVLGHTDIEMRCDVPMVQLQRAGIHLLLSMLCLPCHFGELAIADVSLYKCSNEKSENSENVTFDVLKSKLIKLLVCALENELDSHNTQLLLGGVMLVVQDCALVEEEQDIIPQSPGPDEVEQAFTIQSETVDNTQLSEREKHANTEGKLADENDVSQNEAEETIIKQEDPVNEYRLRGSSASSLFTHLTNLVSQKLIFGSKWKTDFHVTISAFELMSAMAEMTIRNIKKEECQRTIKWLCDYVEYQAKQPGLFHSRDLHSMMVAAFNCLLTWVASHPWLLDDQKTLQAILDVVELGISGTKSKDVENQESEEINSRPKGKKGLKPASSRVRQAAEGVLSYIMEHAGAFPSPCGPASCSSLVDEEILMEFLGEQDQNKQFKYFVIDDSVIVGILQESVQAHDGLSPTATILLRGSTGRTSWTVQLRQIQECKKEVLGVYQSEAPKRPHPNLNIPEATLCNRPHFPAAADSVVLTKANSSIPAVDNISCDKLSQEKDLIQSLIEKQREEESDAQRMIKNDKENSNFPCSLTEMKPPKSVSEFSACRMILARLGFLRPDEFERVRSGNTRSANTLSVLNSTDETFFESVRELDRLPTRCFDTVYVLYVKCRQHDARSILTNEINTCLYKDTFYEFLQSLGWPVDVQEHPGWTGNPASSWKLCYLKNEPDDKQTTTCHSSFESDGSLTAVYEELSRGGSGAQDGRPHECEESKDSVVMEDCHRIIYYADACSEIAFTVPSLFPHPDRKRKKSRNITPRTRRKEYAMKRPQSVTNLSSSASSSSLLQSLPETRGFSLGRQTAETGIDIRHLSILNTHSTSSEINILVIWLERFLDHEVFPDAEVLSELGITKEATTVSSPSGKPGKRETAMIFIAPLHNGLFRIHTKCTIKSPMAGPLVDGMVVSQRSLGAMVRHTAVNIGRRRRLDLDNFSPPHVYRKSKIQDIIRKCRRDLSFPEFYASLFTE